MAAANPARDAPVRQGSLRTHNLALVLRHITMGRRPVSRADVAAATGLTRATVSTLVDDLLAGRLVTEVDPAPRPGAGRPAVGLRLSSSGPAGLGLEINVDYLAACVVGLTGDTRHHEVRAGDQRGRDPDAVLDDVASLAAVAVKAAAAEDLAVAGATLAVPGLVDGNLVRLAPNLGWHDVEVTAALLARPPLAGVPLVIDNEANLAALGELHAGADADPSAERASFLYVSGEIGIGAGIVLDGTLYRGGRGFSGEIGHMTIRPDGSLCRCGARGCLETYANQEAILGAAGLARDDDPGQAGGGAAVARLAALARAGAPVALRALEDAGAALGVAVASVVNLLDVDTVVLGGIYAPLAPWLSGPVEREIAERVLTAAWAPVTVRPSVLGASATVVGAAGSVVRAIRDNPASWLSLSPSI